MTPFRWTADDLSSQVGRRFIVTGANSGIGLPTARALARAGAHVVLAVRDVARGEAAAESISGDCEIRQLDLADLASVRAFAEGWRAEISVLINNAGVMATPQRRTADAWYRATARPSHPGWALCRGFRRGDGEAALDAV